MKVSKIVTALSLMLLMGCTSKQPEKISILVPQGATALATLSVYGSEYADVTAVAGTDIITSELAKAQASYDLIIAPINLGAKMIEKDNTGYRLDAIITWGNLYIVGTADYQKGDDFAAFGEGAVPGFILENAGDTTNVTFYNSVQDVQAQLLSGNVNAGLLAEPSATASIVKAKEKGIELSVLTDMQEAYQSINQTENKGYPQAAIFVKEGSEDKVKDALAQIETFVNDTALNKSEEIAPLIEKAGVDNLGVPSAAIIEKAWSGLNLKYVKANTVEDEITTFLKLFNVTYNNTMLVK